MGIAFERLPHNFSVHQCSRSTNQLCFFAIPKLLERRAHFHLRQDVNVLPAHA